MERDGDVAFNCKYNGLTGEMLEGMFSIRLFFMTNSLTLSLAESDSCPAMAVKSHYCINYLTMVCPLLP